MNSTPFLQSASQKLAANGYGPLQPQVYQPLGFKYAVRRSRFEVLKFGMAESFFLFAEIPNLNAGVLQGFSNQAFNFAGKNKTISLPNGFFMSISCFPVAITENLDPNLGKSVVSSSPVKHWAAFEMPVVYDVTSGGLYYFQNTPLWGAAYFAGFRREVEANLR